MLEYNVHGAASEVAVFKNVRKKCLEKLGPAYKHSETLIMNDKHNWISSSGEMYMFAADI